MLTDFKKNGIIGRDVVLRKSTFDECKGDKFEELLASVVNIVLRKWAQTQPRHIHSIHEIGDNQMVPLILAHKVSLQAKLEQRRLIRKQCNERKQSQALKASSLARYRKDLSRQEPIPELSREGLLEAINDSWAGEKQWVDVLLNGTPHPSGLLTSPEDDSHDSLLRKTQQLVLNQQTYLNELKQQRSLIPTYQVVPKEPAGDKLREPFSVRFNKHRKLQAEEQHLRNSDGESKQHAGQPYKDLLLRLRAELCSPTVDAPIEAGGDSSHIEATSEDVTSSYRVSEETATEHVHTNDSPECSWLGQTPRQERSVLAKETYESAATTAVASEPATPIPAPSLTLEERTHMSLVSVLQHEDPSSSPPQRDEDPVLSSVEEEVTLPTGHVTKEQGLIERTRKSLSLLKTVSSQTTKSRQSRGMRTSQAYPINPFETPRKSILDTGTLTPASDASTPRERLFSDDAEEGSIFKSRPKIALSPMISPERSTFEDDSLLTTRVRDLGLNEVLVDE